jgi:hypothetical protein
LVLDVNGLLCETLHLKYIQNKWKPIVHAMGCGNKFVNFNPTIVSSWSYVAQGLIFPLENGPQPSKNNCNPWYNFY